MREMEFSRLLDAIRAGDLKKSNVEAILIPVAGALLEDDQRVVATCKGMKKYRAAVGRWKELTRKLLDSFDKLLLYFDQRDPEVLESFFDVISVCLQERRELIYHLPPELRPADEEAFSFWDQEPDSAYELFLQSLESLLHRRSMGALQRQISFYSKALSDDDEIFLEEADNIAMRRKYKNLAKKLSQQLSKLYRAEKAEDRMELFESVEELVSDRLTLQQEIG